MWSWSTNVTDRRTDDMRPQDRALHYSASRGKNWPGSIAVPGQQVLHRCFTDDCRSFSPNRITASNARCGAVFIRMSWRSVVCMSVYLSLGVLCKNGWADWGVAWDVDSGGPNKHILYRWGIWGHRRHLANTVNDPCSAAMWTVATITVTTC